MEYFQNLYDSFVAIVGEGICTDDDIKKYIQWGNGNLEISLNYYFQQQTKSSGFQTISSKNQSNSTKNNSSQQGGMKTRQRSQNQQQQQNRDSNNNNQTKIQQALPQSQKQKTLNKDLSQQREEQQFNNFQQDDEDNYLAQPKQKTVNAFQKLQEGSKKMREFDKIIEQLKEEYKKPVQSIVEKKLSVNKDEYSNNICKDQIYQEQSEDISYDENLDYLPSILRRPNPEEAQIPKNYTAKPHIDFTQVEQKIYQQGENEELCSKVQNKEIRNEKGNSQPIFQEKDNIDEQNQQNQNKFIKQEEEENINDISIQQSEIAQQQKSFFQERNKSYSAQSFDKFNVYQEPAQARFQSETTFNENNLGLENSKKKTQSYESFQSGIKDIKQGEEQSLQFPCYLGQFTLTGHALTSSRCDMKKGDDVILKIERNVQTNVAKQKQKAKKSGAQTIQQMIIRLVWREREVGRLDNNYAQILYPLIDRNYIFIQGQFEYAPPYLQAFTQIRVSVKVSLLKTCITKPITQIIEENSNTKESQILRIYSETKDQFAQLFEWLELQMITPTLIQVKGKKKKKEQVDNNQRTSIGNNQNNFNDLNNQSYGNSFQNELNRDYMNDGERLEEEEKEQKKNSNKMLSEDEERENDQNESGDDQKLQEDIFGNQQNTEQESKRMIAEEESQDLSQEIKNTLNDQSKQNNFINSKYSCQDTTNSAPKINLNDPFVKLPKQKTLFSFKLQNTKPDQNQEQQERSARQSNNQQTAENKETAKSQDLDYEQIFNIVPGTDGQVTELQYSEPPTTFKTSLHNYQKQALTWMLSREGKQTDMNEIIKRDTRTLHPLWEKYTLPCSLKFFLYFNPYSGQVSTQFPRAQSDCRGGVLADEMGLGKTVMMLSLIHSNKRKNHQYVANIKEEEEEIDLTDDLNNFLSLKGGSAGQQNQTTITAVFKPKQKNQTLVQMAKKDAGTLIIVPVTLLQQWIDEIQSHSTPNSLTYYAYYGNNRENNLNIYDVVITTYGTISSEFASQSNLNNKNLYKYNWHRIVLDEAHYIKGRVIQIAKAAYSLSGNNRWCMTGTPLQNKLDELFPLIHFIKLEPWSDYIWFNNYINKPHEKGDLVVYDVLKTILRPILLRRTKKSKDINGNSIISLPEKYCFIEKVEFTPEERMFYDKVHQTSKEEFDGFLSQGVLLSNYMKVFELLLRLRQICDHIFLLTTRGDVTNTDGLEQKIKSFVDRRNKALKEQTEQIEKKGKSVYLQNQQNQLELLEGTNGQIDSKHLHFEVILDENNIEQRIEIPDNFNFDYSEIYLNKVVEDIKYNKIPSCNICFEDMEDAVLTACLHVSCRLCAIRSIEFTGMCPICRKFITKEDIMTVPRNNRFTFDPSQKYIRSSKINAVMNYIQSLQKTDDKCLVFTQFLGMMDLFEIDFQKNKILYLRLDGSVNQKQRAEIIKRFNEDNQYKVFMISLKAGGVGLNLVKANHVLMVDPWWNPAVEEQAIERCHRIGQKKEVFVTRFICEDSIESRMIKLHEEKRDLFENTIQATKKDKKEQNIEHFKYLMSTY